MTEIQGVTGAYHIRSAPRAVDRIGDRAIGSTHLSQHLVASELGLGLYNTMLLKVCAKTW
jgi:hypothetical protein